MNDRNTRRILSFLVLAAILSVLRLATPAAIHAAIQAPASAEPRPSARRTAARAIERRSSTQWLSDVAERIRILEEQVERSSTPVDGPRGVAGPTPVPGRSSR